jgi:hypothetical protein
MPRFYFDVQTGAGVEHDTTGVEADDPLKVLGDCFDVLTEVIASTEFNDLRAVTIKNARHEVIATIDVEAIRQAMRLAGDGPDDDTG